MAKSKNMEISLDRDLQLVYDELNKDSKLVGYGLVALIEDKENRYYSLSYRSEDLTYLLGAVKILESGIVNGINEDTGGDPEISSDKEEPEVTIKGKNSIH